MKITNLIKNKKAERTIIIVGAIFLAILFALFISGIITVLGIPSITGHTIKETDNLTKYTQKINLKAEHNTNYDFTLENVQENITLRALAISGKYKYLEQENIGNIKVYLKTKEGKQFLILDDNVLKDIKKAKESKEEIPDSFGEFITGYIIKGITGWVTKEIEKNEGISKEGVSRDENSEDSSSDSSEAIDGKSEDSETETMSDSNQKTQTSSEQQSELTKETQTEQPEESTTEQSTEPEEQSIEEEQLEKQPSEEQSEPEQSPEEEPSESPEEKSEENETEIPEEPEIPENNETENNETEKNEGNEIINKTSENITVINKTLINETIKNMTFENETLINETNETINETEFTIYFKDICDETCDLDLDDKDYTLAVSYKFWVNEPQNLTDHFLGLHIILQNKTSNELSVSWQDFSLLNSEGMQFDVVLPETIMMLLIPEEPYFKPLEMNEEILNEHKYEKEQRMEAKRNLMAESFHFGKILPGARKSGYIFFPKLESDNKLFKLIYRNEEIEFVKEK